MKKSVIGLVVLGATLAGGLTPAGLLAIEYKGSAVVDGGGSNYATYIENGTAWNVMGVDNGGPNGAKRWWLQELPTPRPWPKPYTLEDLLKPCGDSGDKPCGWDVTKPEFGEFFNFDKPFDTSVVAVPFDISGSGTIFGSIIGIGLGVGLKRLKSKKNISLKE